MTGPDLSGAAWHRSSKSGPDNACVEVVALVHQVAVRDSKDPTGPVLLFDREEWRAFVADTRLGMFDLPS